MPEHLWAPWRMKFVEGPKQEGCFLVELPKQNNDRENLILHRGTTAFVILNRYPYTNGHLLIAPYKHTSDLNALNNDELLEINQLVRDSIQWLTQAFNPQGFNVGINLGVSAGAGIPDHIHWHVVPRWSGDTNFMTTVAGVRVHPSSLEDAYDRLRAAQS